MKTVTDIPRLPERKADSHKGDFGKVLIVGGSVGMAGAPTLAANAAFRAGAGMVRLAVPEPILNAVSVLCPCATATGLPVSDAGTLMGSRYVVERLLSLADDNDVLVVGPGLGRNQMTDALVRDLLGGSDRPVVLDADGLRALGPVPNINSSVAARLVLTPHPGEFAFLTDTTPAAVQTDRVAAAEAFLKRNPTVLVLKGHRTLVADTERVYTNDTGNPGMATAGSGDVLTGVIAALIGQGLKRFEAAALGVHLHGLAGDLAAEALGQVSVMATDLIDFLPAAFGRLTGSRFTGFAGRGRA
jgi:NAD(P)H-hydrate epimerase